MKKTKKENFIQCSVNLPESAVIELDNLFDHTIDNRARLLRIIVLDGIKKLKDEKNVLTSKKN